MWKQSWLSTIWSRKRPQWSPTTPQCKKWTKWESTSIVCPIASLFPSPILMGVWNLLKSTWTSVSSRSRQLKCLSWMLGRKTMRRSWESSPLGGLKLLMRLCLCLWLREMSIWRILIICRLLRLRMSLLRLFTIRRGIVVWFFRQTLFSSLLKLSTQSWSPSQVINDFRLKHLETCL